MRIALLAATALVALSSIAVAQNQLAATKQAAPKATPDDPAVPTNVRAPGGRLHYDVPCWVSQGADHCSERPPLRRVPAPKP
jgi:hypothetical protein